VRSCVRLTVVMMNAGIVDVKEAVVMQVVDVMEAVVMQVNIVVERRVNVHGVTGQRVAVADGAFQIR